MTPPVDRRTPIEIWVEICSYLYPSQLTRLSQVSRELYKVVTSLDVWNHYYNRICYMYHHSAGVLRDPLIHSPGATTKLHMLYVVAASYVVCDNCTRVSHARGPEKEAALPLAVQERPLDEGCVSLVKGGSRSMIRLCLSCRRNHFDIYPESIPSEVQGRYLSKQLIMANYPIGSKTLKSINDRRWPHETPSWSWLQDECSVDEAAKYGKWYSEREALKKARFFYGGDVGILAYKNPPNLITKSRKKMDAYFDFASSYRFKQKWQNNEDMRV